MRNYPKAHKMNKFKSSRRSVEDSYDLGGVKYERAKGSSEPPATRESISFEDVGMLPKIHQIPDHEL